MPIPQQVNDRIKEAPAVMLRAVFAGVGQLLLAADKVRARAAGTGWPHDRTAPKGGVAGSGLAKGGAAGPELAARQARGQSRWHTLDDNRNQSVPLAREGTDALHHPAQRPAAANPVAGGPGSATAGPASAATAAPPPRPAPTAAEPVTLAEPADPPAPAGPAVQAGLTADAPPLPGYDDMSLPSLRARLRVLDAATLRALLDYEKAHAHRDDVITLFERRLEKITAQ